jgi:radical SAM superfamily enzyme YgiQ (UPF0313 family)
VVIAGGSGTSVSPREWLAQFSALDYVIVGEDERRLAALAAQIEAVGALEHAIPGVFDRGLQHQDPRPDPGSPTLTGSDHDTAPLDELPPPDFDEYAELADAHNIV